MCKHDWEQSVETGGRQEQRSTVVWLAWPGTRPLWAGLGGPGTASPAHPTANDSMAVKSLKGYGLASWPEEPLTCQKCNTICLSKNAQLCKWRRNQTCAFLWGQTQPMTGPSLRVHAGVPRASLCSAWCLPLPRPCLVRSGKSSLPPPWW